EPGKAVEFNVNLQNPEQYEVKGSELSQKLKDFAVQKSRIDFVRDSLQQAFSSATNNLDANGIQNLRSEMLMKFEPFFKNYIAEAVSFAQKNNDLAGRSEEHTSELQSRENLVCRLLLEKKK